MRTKIVCLSSKTEDKLGLQAYLDALSEDNSDQRRLLQSALHLAIQTELTPRQQDMLWRYYFEGQTITRIAQEYGLNKSTVSRHIARSRTRLEKVLKYLLLQRPMTGE